MSRVKSVHEPLFHIVKRDRIPLWKSMAIRVLAVLAAFLVCSLFAWIFAGVSPVKLISTMIDGTFGTERRMWQMGKELALLLGIALALTPAFLMRFWNIGGEGQVLVGSLASIACVVKYGGKLPEPALLLMMLAAALLAGAVWGFIPSFFKAIWNSNETLFTLMMNYIAIQLTAFMIAIWEPKDNTLGELNFGHLNLFPFVDNYGDELTLIVIVLAVAVLMYVYLRYSKHGYEISVVGDSTGTAHYAGMKVNTIVLRTVFLSACLIGLASAFKVGTAGVLSTAITDDVGWTGIIVAWLSHLNTAVIFVVSALISMLHYGSVAAAATFSKVDSSFANMLQGVILFLVLTAEFFIRFRVVRNKKGGKQ